MGVCSTYMAVNMLRAHPLYAINPLAQKGNSRGEGYAPVSVTDYKPNYTDGLSISPEAKAMAKEAIDKVLGIGKNTNVDKDYFARDNYYANGNYNANGTDKLNENKELFDEKGNKIDKDGKKLDNKETAPNGKELSEGQKEMVRKLAERDQEVRVHEQAHISAGGGLVSGGASYTYQVGPDGKQYAIGGEVSIDTSAVEGNPEATIRKMQQVQRAALAPADPSGQDYAVAANARRTEAEARRQLSDKTREDAKPKTDYAGEIKRLKGELADLLAKADANAGKGNDKSAQLSASYGAAKNFLATMPIINKIG